MVIATDQPRLTEDDASDVAAKFVVALSSLPALVADELKANMADKMRTTSLKQHPKAEKYLSDGLDCTWEGFGEYLNTAVVVNDVEGERELSREVTMARQIQRTLDIPDDAITDHSGTLSAQWTKEALRRHWL